MRFLDKRNLRREGHPVAAPWGVGGHSEGHCKAHNAVIGHEIRSGVAGQQLTSSQFSATLKYIWHIATVEGNFSWVTPGHKCVAHCWQTLHWKRTESWKEKAICVRLDLTWGGRRRNGMGARVLKFCSWKTGGVDWLGESQCSFQTASNTPTGLSL